MAQKLIKMSKRGNKTSLQPTRMIKTMFKSKNQFKIVKNTDFMDTFNVHTQAFKM